MPVTKKEGTTSATSPKTVEQASPQLPGQQAFHQHLRALTRSAVRVVIEEVMLNELTIRGAFMYSVKSYTVRRFSVLMGHWLWHPVHFHPSNAAHQSL